MYSTSSLFALDIIRVKNSVVFNVEINRVSWSRIKSKLSLLLLRIKFSKLFSVLECSTLKS